MVTKIPLILAAVVAVVAVAALLTVGTPSGDEERTGIVVDGFQEGMTVTRGQLKTVVVYFYDAEGNELGGQSGYYGIYNSAGQLAPGSDSDWIASGTALTLSIVTVPGTYSLRVVWTTAPTLSWSGSFEVV
jgi:hypothetical protein